MSAPAVVHGGVFAVSGNGGGCGVWCGWDVWGGVVLAGWSRFGLRYKDWCILILTFPHDFVESWWLEGVGGVSVALGL
ncbi:hypothetical protein, partial [Actinomyces sp. Z5]|uniref:hypothetical protein n=1 Tax=Actinomyces sp. Z5 TaxID=2250216 RepID=UPI001C65578E